SFAVSGSHPDLHSFPTRRSSDLSGESLAAFEGRATHSTGRASPPGCVALRSNIPRIAPALHNPHGGDPPVLSSHLAGGAPRPSRDRKSTRLNSSHRTISYAVFCL